MLDIIKHQILSTKLSLKTLFILGIGSSLLSLFKVASAHSYLWDLEVYQNAVDVYLSGGSAYQDLEGLKFVYPPLVLYVFSLFGTFLTPALLTLFVLCSLAFLSNREGRMLTYSAVLASFCFYHGSAFFISLLTGNVSIFMHFLILFTAFKARYGSKFLFYIAVFFSSLIKPYYASYLILIFGLPNLSRKKILESSIIVFAVITIYLLQFTLFYPLFEQFIQSLAEQSFDLKKTDSTDIGYSPYSFFIRIYSQQTALLIHAFFVLIGLKTLYFTTKFNQKYLETKDASFILFLWLIILAIFMNPRIKEYDYWLIQAASIRLILFLSKDKNTYSPLLFSCGCLMFLLKAGKLIYGGYFEGLTIFLHLYAPIAMAMYINYISISKHQKLFFSRELAKFNKGISS